MITLVSMERPKPDKKEAVKECCVTDSYYEKYPWGLRITLEDDALEKIGIDISKLTVGGTLNVAAKAIVVEVSQRQSMDDAGAQKQRNRLEFQITDLGLEGDESFEDAFKESADGAE